MALKQFSLNYQIYNKIQYNSNLNIEIQIIDHCSHIESADMILFLYKHSSINFYVTIDSVIQKTQINFKRIIVSWFKAIK